MVKLTRAEWIQAGLCAGGFFVIGIITTIFPAIFDSVFMSEIGGQTAVFCFLAMVVILIKGAFRSHKP